MWRVKGPWNEPRSHRWISEPLLDEAQTFAVDTVLIAVGLVPVDEYFADAQEFGFPVVKTGDADEIAEASSAMLGGRIAGRKMARLLGMDAVIPTEWQEKMEILKSRPGQTWERSKPELSQESFRPVFHCVQEIPCNPCTTVCRFDSIKLKGETGTIMDLPEFEGRCIACGLCVAICPGFVITLARLSEKPGLAEVVLPHEFANTYEPGSQVTLCDIDGNVLGQGTVLAQRFSRNTTRILLLWRFRPVGSFSSRHPRPSPEMVEPLPGAV